MSISGTVPHMILVFGNHVYMCKMMMSLAVFCHFSNILIFRVLGEGGGGGQKITHYYQFQSATFYISRTVDHIIKILGTQV